MTRVKRGTITKKKHKKVLKLAKGFYGARSKTFKAAKQSVIKSQQYAYRDRRIKKRYFKSLWIITINAALKKHAIKYSEFINKMQKSEMKINRKILYSIIKTNINIFNDIVDIIKADNDYKKL